MKRLIFIFCMCVGMVANSQLIHVDGNKGLGLEYLEAVKGKAWGLTGYSFINERMYLFAGLNYESGQYSPLTDYANMSLEFGYSRCLTLKSSAVYFNPLGGLALNVETYQNQEFDANYFEGKRNFYENSNFSYSIFLGGEAEWYFFKTVALTLKFKQYYTYKSLFGNFRLQAGPGVKVLF